MKIFLPVSIFPKSRQIRLIPDFNRPQQNLIFPITLHKMTKRVLHKARPLIIIRRGRNITLPVKYRLFAACHLFRHKTKLNKWTDFQILISIHHHIQISKIIFFFHGTIRRNKFLINCHVLTEKSMTTDIVKSNLFLDQC